MGTHGGQYRRMGKLVFHTRTRLAKHCHEFCTLRAHPDRYIRNTYIYIYIYVYIYIYIYILYTHACHTTRLEYQQSLTNTISQLGFLSVELATTPRKSMLPYHTYIHGAYGIFPSRDPQIGNCKKQLSPHPQLFVYDCWPIWGLLKLGTSTSASRHYLESTRRESRSHLRRGPIRLVATGLLDVWISLKGLIGKIYEQSQKESNR